MNIIAVTACPLGVANTYMAAEGLQRAAKEFGFNIKVETQGFMGIENELTIEDLSNCDVVILTKDKNIDKMDRFKDKKIVYITIFDAIRNSHKILKDLKNNLKYS
ncbi:PTS fructose transporter subunit IIB [Clostridiaceae bacterium M8S5]|nr:PTS fructose transporter subunit IIB [Clostridiaceae bacterium M8S5]